MTTLRELRTLAKDLKIRGYSTAKKDRLIQLLEDHHHVASLTKGTAPASAPAPSDAPEPAPAPSKASESFVVPETDEPAQDAPAVPAKKEKKPRKANAWNSFLRDYRKENNCTLKVAMSRRDEYATYKAAYAPPASE